MTVLSEQLEIFKLLGATLKKNAECYVIGGSALLFYGFKTATKDTDLVFTSGEERKAVIKALEEMGFARRSYKIQEWKAAAGKEQCVMMERKEDRFDLFLNDVVTTKLSPGMKSRIREKHEFSSLIVNVVSPEDIIALKCATDRAGDRKDAADMINSMRIDWNVILEEAKWQAANGKKSFMVLLSDFVNDLVDDYEAPVPKDFVKILRKEYKAALIEILGREKFGELSKRKPRQEK